mgnify:CR=1 FL=1
MSDKPRLDTTRLQKIAQAYWESAALMAAVELDLFTAIAHGHDTIPTLAQAIEAAERAVELAPQDPRALELRGLLIREQFGLQALAEQRYPAR